MIAQLQIDYESKKFTFIEVNPPERYLIRCSICESNIMNTPFLLRLYRSRKGTLTEASSICKNCYEEIK
jgi:hypothetical protein